MSYSNAYDLLVTLGHTQAMKYAADVAQALSNDTSTNRSTADASADTFSDTLIAALGLIGHGTASTPVPVPPTLLKRIVSMITPIKSSVDVSSTLSRSIDNMKTVKLALINDKLDTAFVVVFQSTISDYNTVVSWLYG